MRMYHDHLQNCLDFGQSLLIFLILTAFLHSEIEVIGKSCVHNGASELVFTDKDELKAKVEYYAGGLQ